MAENSLLFIMLWIFVDFWTISVSQGQTNQLTLLQNTQPFTLLPVLAVTDSELTCVSLCRAERSAYDFWALNFDTKLIQKFIGCSAHTWM